MIESQAIAGSGGRTLIYVHGKNFKPDADSLLDTALAALAAGIERDYPERLDDFRTVRAEVAYYGDITNAFLEERGDYYDAQLDLGDRHNALQQLRAINRRKKFCLAAYDKLPGKSAMPELAAGIAAPVLGSLGLSNVLIAKVAPDLDAYWKKGSALGKAIRDAVRRPIVAAFERGDQVLLLSHGTGCIVAWDVLWGLSCDERFADCHDCKVNTWITLGAPLGDSMVKRRLAGARKKGRERYPSNLVSWHNVSAEDDWMCHDNTLADDYKAMLANKQISTIRDYRIHNMAVRYGKSNPHASLGYLVHPRVSHLVAEWLGRADLAASPKHIL